MTRLFPLLITFLLSFSALHPDSISFHADSMQAELAKGKERTVLTGIIKRPDDVGCASAGSDTV